MIAAHPRPTLAPDDPVTAAGLAALLAGRLVPDRMWELFAALIPPRAPRPQGGGPRHVDDRATLAAIVYVLMADVSWSRLLPELGVAFPTAYRRFMWWHDHHLWTRLDHHATALGNPTHDELWCRAVARTALNRINRAPLRQRHHHPPNTPKATP